MKRHWNWHGVAALALAVGVSAGLIILCIMELVRDGHVTPEEATLLATGFGAAVGAVATYLGGHDYAPPPPPDLASPPPRQGGAMTEQTPTPDQPNQPPPAPFPDSDNVPEQEQPAPGEAEPELPPESEPAPGAEPDEGDLQGMGGDEDTGTV